jgi:hypothetical protein
MQAINMASLMSVNILGVPMVANIQFKIKFLSNSLSVDVMWKHEQMNSSGILT